MKSVSKPLLLAAILFFSAMPLLAQKSAALSDEEEDKLRDAQDPGERIKVYLEIARARLSRFENFRNRPADSPYDIGKYLDDVMGQYILVDDELKNWISTQYENNGDMRAGLRALLDEGPKQLDELRHIQQTPDAFASRYAETLRDAIRDLDDTLSGASKAFAEQEKKFGELKRQEKASQQEAKREEKEQEKRLKKERKLQKREQKHAPPSDSDEDD